MLFLWLVTIMKKSLTILLLMCLSALCHELRAQNIDSLDNIVATALSESRRIEAISQLSFCTIGIDDERSEECFGEAISFYIKEEELPAAFELINRRIAKCNELGRTDLVIKTIDGQQAFLSQHGSSPEVVKVYNAASYAMIDEQDFELAAIYLMKSQAIAEANRDTSTMINNAFNLGYCYGKIDDYNQAIENFKEAERLTILSGDAHGLIDIYMNLGTAYEYGHSLDTALEYHFKSLKYCIQTNDKSLLWLLYYNVAYTYFDYEKYEEALTYCRRSIEAELDADCPRQKDYPMLYSLVAKVFSNLGQNDSVIRYHQLCLDIYREQGNIEGEAESYSLLGDTYRAEKNYRRAIDYYNKALDICLKNNLLDLQKNIYEGMSKLYSDNGKYELAFRTLEKAGQVTDSMLCNEKEQARISLTKQLQTKEQVMLIEHEISENHQRELFLTERQNARHRMLIGILVMVGLIAVVVALMLMHVRKINSLLKKANTEINMQKSQLEKASVEIRRRYQFLDLLINTIPAPFLFFKNDKSSVVGCNKAFEQYFGFSRDLIIGFDIDTLRNKISIDWNIGDIHNDGQVMQIQFPDGRVRDVICYISKLTDEGGYGDLLSLLIVDVTENEDVRRELCKSQKKLEDALNVKTKFFSIFAHDLKNPFNGILGMTNLISEYYENYSADEIQKYLNVINDSATHVYNLLTNLLDWAKSQTGMLEVNQSNFYITEPISEAIAVNKYNIDLKHIKIDLQIEYEYAVVADKNMILTVFRNLIGNALKYTPAGGQITIVVRLDADSKVSVSIGDNGIGIPSENLQRLFNVDQPITTPGLENEKGSGLGLIICQEFIRRNGGQISVSSEVGKGTTFTFALNRA